MLTNTLGRYFAGKFVAAAIAVFMGVFILVVLVDYIEMTRKTSGINASTWLVVQTSLFRVPQLLERLMPFCVLIAAMTCYLDLSRRLELVVARSAGVSAWQFLTPALASAFVLGTLATVVYNPVSANLQEQAQANEVELFGDRTQMLQDALGFWFNQATSEGQTIINAASSQRRGVVLSGLTVFRFDPSGRFSERIEAREATLEDGYWLLKNVRRHTFTEPVLVEDSYRLNTSLTPDQVRGNFANPESVSFWELPDYITSSENSGLSTAGYRLQYQKLLSRPFLFAAMVLLASAVSLRFFRLGGVQKMVLSGIAAGFLLYVLSKVTEDLSKAELMHPVSAAWLPVAVGSLAGLLALLHQEDG
ncbi:LPS export ABC transporter permease LptG [Bradyrhizobium sp. LHD-71]|uniref:LPS export ABC transporter permease LptG n=1 Tax=Bradyrhizobium sp. LHD-71 TaxID=3072141 RepID=UPI00280EDEF5|nr:LPS export ABC transporter permease LptG [Bradyrhizobium sp. LHD-71]MDQ8729888.1 LPS export ABC transporter permease LptG [Bradyrhizobium sp. LHD-71]